MKIARKKVQTVAIEDVSQNLIIVGKINGYPVMVTKSWESKRFRFTKLSDGFTYGNGYTPVGEEVTLAKLIETYIDGRDNEFHAFPNWRHALEWLLENA